MATVSNTKAPLTPDVYCFPRFSILPQHGPKALIPRSEVFTKGRINDPAKEPDTIPERVADAASHEMLQGLVIGMTPNSVSVLLPAEGSYDDVKDDGSDAPPERIRRIEFDYAVYALGSGMPAPCDVWGEIGRKQLPGRGTKTGTIEWLANYGDEIKKAKRVIIVGGGALGIQYATDIKETTPDVEVTLLHSREQLLPVYHPEVHDVVIQRFKELGINYSLGDRVLTWPENPGFVDGKTKTVVTEKGATYEGDIVLACTGPRPHVEFIAALNPEAVAETGRLRVDEHLAIQGLPHIYAIGDAADTDAILAGHMSNGMGGVASRNILRQIAGNPLEKYVLDPTGQRIKVSLGLKDAVIASLSGANRIDTGAEDINARLMWAVYGAQDLEDDA